MKKITIKANDEWFHILGIISRHQEGFIWVSVEEEEND